MKNILALLAWLALCLPAFAQAPASPLPASLLGAGVQQVATGSSHSCALTSAGAVQCWGANNYGQLGDGSLTSSKAPTAVSGLAGGVVAIAAGHDHSCALTSAGAVQCWGYNNNGQLGDGSTTPRHTPTAVTGLASGVAAIAAGVYHSCALTSAGAVQCWGYNGDGQLGDGSATDHHTPTAIPTLSSGVAAIAAGTGHSCALTSAGAVQCWGLNDYGQLGDGSTVQRNTPTAVTGLANGVATIAAGANHSCALTSAGAVQCWGFNAYGQLGDGSLTNRSTPTVIPTLASGVASIAAGGAHTCALTSAGAVQCWGSNGTGQLGDGSTTSRKMPTAVTGLGSGVAAIAAGVYHSCALTRAGAVQCWGDNYYGQLGDGSTDQRNTPTAVSGLANPVATIAAGAYHSCALTSAGAGAVQCWGYNAAGQLGDGSITNRHTPTAVTGLANGVATIAAGAYHSCALTSAGAVQCWGSNNYGQLGDGSTTDRHTPTAVTGLGSGVAAIAVGDSHSCALTSAGAVQCWGWNNNGQLGDGSTTHRHTPTAVTGLANGVAAIAAGIYHSCALTSAGAVQCWGHNASGQLGDGSTVQRNTPTAVTGLANGVATIAAGANHSCALTSAGAVQCWGFNAYGQLGDGSLTNRSTPTAIPTLASGVAAIVAGGAHTCALTSAGAAQCWGSNSKGQLGDGSTTQRRTPTAIPTLSSGVAAIAAGHDQSCALTSAGAVQCWGYNYYGQLGDGSTTQRHTPTHIAASQALAFAPVTPAPLRAGSSTTLSATASSALAVAFDTWTPDVCTVSGTTLSVLAGKANHLCGVRALQMGGTGAGGTHFIAAPQRLQLLSIEAQTNAPDAPTAVTAVAGDGAVTIIWTTPASDGGSALTGYTVTGSPSGSCTAAPPATTCTISGLTNGVPYTFTVAATNGVGVGTASVPSSAVAPIAPLLGVCGASHGVATPTSPPIGSNLCSTGSWAAYTFDAYGWAWKCNGTNGGAQASCQAPKGYTVTPSASGNGSISPATSQVVAVNTRANFTVMPQTGHSAVLGGTCGGSLSGSTYTTNFITGACTVQASFAPATYPITTSASPASGGTVACTSNPVTHGQGTTCSATSATGYRFTGWTGDCTGTGACQMDNVTGARSVTAQFALDGVCGTSHGVATPTPPPTSSLCSAGSWVSYTFDGYGWAWKCNGTNGGAQASCQAPKGYTVTPSASGNGSISPSTPQVVAVNTSASFTVTPQAGHSAALGGTCGGSLVGDTYTTAAITGDCTVQASFATATYPITTSASPASGGTVACTPNPVELSQDAACTATPATGYQLTGWTGDCSGTGACQLSGVTSARSVGVTFGLAPAPAACASTTVLHAAPNGSGDGSSWLQPAALQQALALANGDADLGQCYEIRLRQGVYKPGPAGRPELHFAIDRPMQIKGGYTGNAAQPDERVLHASDTVLSGDIGGDDDVNAQGITEVARFFSDGSTPLQGNQHIGINSYHVVVIGGAVDDSNGNGIYTATEGDARFTLLEGLTITAGGTSVDWGAIAEFDSKGSGLLCNGAGTGRQCSPALRHLRFSGNYGWAGGGLFNNGQRSGNSSPVIAGTTFSGNWVAQWGSALFNNAVSSGTSSPGITNSTFSGNHAFLDGAAVYNDGTGARPTVGHSTFSGNAVMDTAMGSILYGRSSMAASIVWDNTGKPIGGTGATVTYSIVQGGRAGTGNLNVDPLLGPLQYNSGATPTQLPASASPAIDAVDCAAAPATDQRGLARPQGSRCDLGAVEVVPPLVDGACGVADGVAARTAPVAQLCSVGVQGGVDISAADAFVWPCAGTGGGATAQCSAPRQYLITLDITGDGTATPATPLAVAYGQAAQFTLAPGVGQAVASASGCGGSLSGSTYTTGAVTADCTVSAGFHQPPPPPPPPPPGPDPINGACGTSHGQTLPVAPQTNLCRSGTASAVSGTGPWSWSCSGQYGGGHASCSAQVSAPPPTQGPVLDEDFVRQQYLDLLHRSADGAGLAYWHEQLRSGQVSRAELVQRFVVSTEFQGRIAPIVRLYFAYFGRVPDYAGLQFWINTMYPQGTPSVVGLDSVSQAFAASPEFERTYGALSDADFVGLVYRNVLDREPDGPGQTHWLAQLQNGLSRGSLMAQFSESAEYQDFTQDAGQVVIAYVGLLRRAPETAGFEYWLNYLEQGGSFMQLIDGLLRSPEYNQRFAVP